MMAGFASLGAGAIHAAAIGVHNDHPAAVFTFTVLATVQIAWGVAAVARRPPGRVLILVGALINIGALGGEVGVPGNDQYFVSRAFGDLDGDGNRVWFQSLWARTAIYVSTTAGWE